MKTGFYCVFVQRNLSIEIESHHDLFPLVQSVETFS
ncbi:hypothetical protein T4B_7017 [Trichinella pseudospiralis]|uniref:Uncharacterized protein n=1 Tax=Trichinella pseudospiralis TaxID=6337 RepID=A0A0V1GDX1_TRIPS|nr:hypothetical protein T4C_2009 [Trichinella pseudospiralis]KRY96415.1 hypothetical protein T4B_7017 [Trichinella pseudospiralis]